MKFQKI